MFIQTEVKRLQIFRSFSFAPMFPVQCLVCSTQPDYYYGRFYFQNSYFAWFNRNNREEKMRILVIFLQHLLVLVTMKIRSTGSLTLTSKLKNILDEQCNIFNLLKQHKIPLLKISFHRKDVHKILFSFSSNFPIIQSSKASKLMIYVPSFTLIEKFLNDCTSVHKDDKEWFILRTL